MPVGREAERGVVGDVKGAFETWNGQDWVPMDTFEDFHSQKSFFFGCTGGMYSCDMEYVCGVVAHFGR